MFTHFVQADHISNIASGGDAQLSVTGGQAKASRGSGMTSLPFGGVHVPFDLLTVVG